MYNIEDAMLGVNDSSGSEKNKKYNFKKNLDAQHKQYFFFMATLEPWMELDITPVSTGWFMFR